ncbi:hypothetical protein NE237_017777 [Protea cynaroides]|uniref:Uncharacterized protein n=1 Tax=Protea cynaroides TaxID=273540 RepID=A0A9Q0K8N6_9MAGN|nr:hypothetical protein NE237_017777 [Protea cynaroides]
MMERTPEYRRCFFIPSVKVLAYTYSGEFLMSPYTIPMLWNAIYNIVALYSMTTRTTMKDTTITIPIARQRTSREIIPTARARRNSTERDSLGQVLVGCDQSEDPQGLR